MALSPSQTLAELEKIGHRPKQKLGQNYLIDGNIVAKSLKLADVRQGDHVIEVGPGLGTLTRSLLEHGAQVWAVEFDPRMVAYLESELLPHWPDQLNLQSGDAVDFPRAGFQPASDASAFKVVANLPYAISTPWLAALLEGPLPERMVLMLQRETADRFAANVGTKQFGPISIWLQSAYEVLPGHPVPPGCFYPQPEVDSYLLNLRRRTAPQVFAPEMRQLMRQIFQQRRKQLGSVVRKIKNDAAISWLDALPAHGCSAQSRAEDVPLAAWQQLAQFTCSQAEADRDPAPASTKPHANENPRRDSTA